MCAYVTSKMLKICSVLSTVIIEPPDYWDPSKKTKTNASVNQKV